MTNKHSKNMNGEEKRWASRTSLWLKVSLYQDSILTKYGLATNFSLGGLLILCNQKNLTNGQKLEIIFDHDIQGIDKHYHIPVEITRITNEGIAVSFCEHDINSFSCIQKILSVTNMQNHHELSTPSKKTAKHAAA